MDGERRIEIDELPVEVVVEVVLAGDQRQGELREGLRAMAAAAKERSPHGWVARVAGAYREADRALYAEQAQADQQGWLLRN